MLKDLTTGGEEAKLMKAVMNTVQTPSEYLNMVTDCELRAIDIAAIIGRYRLDLFQIRLDQLQ